MKQQKLEEYTRKRDERKSSREVEYLQSMMPEVRQEGYTCVSGCQNCIPCGGNPYTERE